MFFVPMIAGMMIGAFANSRLSGIISSTRLAGAGMVIAMTAGVLNVALALVPGAPPLPWAVAGPSVLALGTSLCFPILQLSMLDLFPHQRGSAASMQSFVQLLLNAALAGVVAPLVTGSIATLAMTSLGFIIAGSLLWLWHRASGRRVTDVG